MTYLSTQEVAGLINVTETTVKRWADEGKIPCHKTLGGHRKFLLKDIVQFAEANVYPLSGTVTPPLPQRHAEALEFAVHAKNYQKIADLFYEEALKADRKALYEMLSYLCKHHISLTILADQVVRPAMTRLGDEWRAGNLNIDQEHMTSYAVLEALVNLNPELHRKPSRGLTAICACTEGDYHELGLRMLAYTLETEGWKVHYLGANTPFHTLRSVMKSTRPDLLCLSATILEGKKKLVGNIRSMGKTARAIGAAFVIGGSFSNSYRPADFNCHHVAHSVQETISFLRDRFRLKPGPKTS
jgi:excisionase family DNA binding protein